MAAIDTHPQLEITSRAQWRRWLQKHHASSEGIWLVTYKKATVGKHVSYAEAVEEALCYGWIDSRPKKIDAERSALLYTPRKASSVWSAVNKKRVAALIENGMMRDAGLEKIERAKADGSWQKLEFSDALTEPDDLKAALAKSKAARKNWDAFPPSARKATLEWIYAAKREETRAARVREAAELSEKNIRPRAWKPKDA